MNGNKIHMVSIVLPVYNRGSLILETINSVLAQSYNNLELIVINDQSTDDTEIVVNSIKDDRVKLIATKTRLGITGSRQLGVDHAAGDYIAFIDSDDLWDKFKLEKQIAAMETHPDAGFCLTGGYNFRMPGQPLEFFYQQRSGIRYDHLLIPLFRSEVAALTPSLIFKKDCLLKTGFGQHLEFLLQLALHYKGIILYEPLLFRRMHDGNISNAEWSHRNEEGIRIMRKFSKNVPSTIAHESLFKMYIHSGEQYLDHGAKRKAVSRFLAAIKYKPFSIVPIKKVLKAFLHTGKK